MAHSIIWLNNLSTTSWSVYPHCIDQCIGHHGQLYACTASSLVEVVDIPRQLGIHLVGAEEVVGPALASATCKVLMNLLSNQTAASRDPFDR